MIQRDSSYRLIRIAPRLLGLVVVAFHPTFAVAGDARHAGDLVAGTHWRYNPAVRFQVALPAGSPMGEASLREHAVAWHPGKKKFYLVADVVPLASPHHPNTYNTDLGLWSSQDLAAWRFHGIAVPRGTPGETYDGYGVASPAGMAYFRGSLWVPFSARRTPRFSERSIGLAYSGEDPERLPWSKTASPISDLDGEDDDPAVVVLASAGPLHLYHRSTAGGYHIVHSASPKPEQPGSWPKARRVTSPAADVRAQELTGVAYLDHQVHLFVIEHLRPGMKIGHFCSREPDALFSYADPARRFVERQPPRLAYGGHLTPVVRDGRLLALSWTVMQGSQRYGIEGHAASWLSERPSHGAAGSAAQAIPLGEPPLGDGHAYLAGFLSPRCSITIRPSWVPWIPSTEFCSITADAFSSSIWKAVGGSGCKLTGYQK